MRFLLLTLCLSITATAAFAQARRPSHCLALASSTPGVEYVQLAAFGDPVADFNIRIRYIDHATFLLKTSGGLSAVTDYTGFLGVTDFVPTVATMNHAHETHWTSTPDPRIPHVLQGWAKDGAPADHHLDLGGMLVRNVPTNIRSRFGSGAEENGNSIFIFESEGLCIGHLGHLHHEPSAGQYAMIGRLDVVMAAVDGGVSLELPTMMRVLKRLRSSIVIPMHWFDGASLEDFLSGMSDVFDIERVSGSTIDVSLRTLPDRPTVMLLRPSYLSAAD
ncbi:MAG: MBL fold metallo-hydrolase [Pseudomonadota bacterium]